MPRADAVLQVVLLVDLDYSCSFLEGAAAAGVPVHVIGIDRFRPTVEGFPVQSAAWLPEDDFHLPQILPLLRGLMSRNKPAPGLPDDAATPMMVVTLRERSVRLAAELAALAPCAGISLRAATLFRDKWEMGLAAAQLGVPIPETRAFGQPWQADDFPAGGVMLKPRRGSVSLGLQACPTLADLERALRAVRNPETYISQAYVDGPMYFVDAVVRQGQSRCVMLGKHLVPLGQVGRSPRAFTRSWALAPGLPERAEAPLALHGLLLRHHDTIVRGFGLVDGCTHIEFFEGGGTPLFCEAAARAGGPRILALQRSLWGTTQAALFAASLAAMPPPVPAARSPVVGLIDFVAEGPVADCRFTRALDAPWVLDVTDWDAAKVQGGRYTDPLKRIMIAASDVAECERRLAWLAEGFSYRLLPSARPR